MYCKYSIWIYYIGKFLPKLPPFALKDKLKNAFINSIDKVYIFIDLSILSEILGRESPAILAVSLFPVFPYARDMA